MPDDLDQSATVSCRSAMPGALDHSAIHTNIQLAFRQKVLKIGVTPFSEGKQQSTYH